jgi:hypothetical protein
MVHGFIQADNVHNRQSVKANGKQCLSVVKNGFATGTAIGCVAGMELFIRVYEGYDIYNEVTVFLGSTKKEPSRPLETGQLSC